METHYRKLRSMGVRADVALWAARLFVRFISPPTAGDYKLVADLTNRALHHVVRELLRDVRPR